MHFPSIQSLLTPEDDPVFWEAALRHILGPLEGDDIIAQIGACSHWIRPHGGFWAADGGFAYPAGYDPTTTGWSFTASPQFDWSVLWKLVVATQGGAAVTIWEPATKRPKKALLLRVAIPSRTARHLQAAVHTLWKPGSPGNPRQPSRTFFGFRKKGGEWRCTAEQTFS